VNKWMIDVHNNKLIQQNMEKIIKIYKPSEFIGNITFS